MSNNTRACCNAIIRTTGMACGNRGQTKYGGRCGHHRSITIAVNSRIDAAADHGIVRLAVPASYMAIADIQRRLIAAAMV